MKNCIGKELSKIPMPVSVWEVVLLPRWHLSMLIVCVNYVSLSLMFHSYFIVSSGKLQWASFNAAASHWGSRIPWASGQSSTLWVLPGADVPGCCLLCFLLLHHSSPDSQALQPPAGWDLWAWSTGGVWLPLTVWAGNATATGSFYIQSLCGARTHDTNWHQAGFSKQFKGLNIFSTSFFIVMSIFHLRWAITPLQLHIMWFPNEAGPCGRKSPSPASSVANTSP